MKILVLVAGTNEPSNAKLLADRFLEGIKRVEGMDAELIRLKDLHIDHFHLGHYEPGMDQGEDFRRIQDAVQGAAGVVLASPIWNFSVPAHLKNLIDRMGSFGLDAQARSLGTFKGKPFFLLYTGGTPKTAWPLMRRTTSHVPVSIRYFGGSILGTHYEPRCTLGRGKFGVVVDQRPDSCEEVRKKGEAFARVAKRFAETGKLPLKEVILNVLARWGQQIKKKMGI